jgi:hypothetical protein
MFAFFLAPEFLAGVASFFGGAYFGAKNTAAVVHPQDTSAQHISWLKVGLYGAGGLALFWLARKSGALKFAGFK